MRHGFSRRLRTAALVALLLASVSAAPAADSRGVAAVRELLAAGKGEEALAKAKLLLVSEGDQADTLELASDAAVAAKSADEALWFAHAARAAALRANRSDRAAALAAKAAALEPPGLPAAAPLDEAASAQLAAAQLCVRKRYFVNAVQILARLESSPLGPKAEVELEKIYGTKQAVAALLDSMVPVPPTATNRKARAKAAKEDARHDTWTNAITVKGANYDVVCDAGADLAQSVSAAMEPMNRFYRKVFGAKGKPLGGEVRRCTVRIFKSKAEMDDVTKIQRNVLGFYDPNNNSVTVYDPRSEGNPLVSMWNTLFHEASHQFTEMISGQAVPSWLNEGTASYFEGAALRADGRVDTNLVPSYRLEGCMEALKTGSPSVKDVLSYAERGSYPDEYYPVGWALVYFLRNFQNEKFEKVYEKPYSLLLDSYRGAGGLPSFERFVKFVITDAKQPGVADFASFEARFRKWIEDLDYFHGGAAGAERDFTERAKQHLALGHKDEAEDDFRLALDRNPDFLPALSGLGELCVTLGRRDEAISCHRRAWEAVRRDRASAGFTSLDTAEASAAAGACLAAAVKIDPEMGRAFEAMDAELAAKTLAQADAYVAAKMPRNALRVLDAASLLLSGASDVEDRRRAVAEESKVDVLLPRPIDIGPGADRVWSSPGWVREGTKLTAPKTKASLLTFDAGLGDRWRFEATIRPGTASGEYPYVGIVFGTDAEGAWECAGLNDGAIEVAKAATAWKQFPGSVGLVPEQMKSFRLGVEARPRLLRLLLDGQVVKELDLPAGTLRGGIGLIVIDATAEFDQLALSY